eukprot:3174566-Pyramimonas_sp.AAC.1
MLTHLTSSGSSYPRALTWVHGAVYPSLFIPKSVWAPTLSSLFSSVHLSPHLQRLLSAGSFSSA